MIFLRMALMGCKLLARYLISDLELIWIMKFLVNGQKICKMEQKDWVLKLLNIEFYENLYNALILMTYFQEDKTWDYADLLLF